MPTTTQIRLTPYQAFIANGSDISNPNANSGYQPALTRELARVGTKGGVVHLNAEGLQDLADFADALSNAEAQGGNPSGARSLANLAARCRTEGST
jgi:hypothetical protein